MDNLKYQLGRASLGHSLIVGLFMAASCDRPRLCFGQSEALLRVGESVQLAVGEVSDSSCTDLEHAERGKWWSDNSKIAIVEGGRVRGTSVGKTAVHFQIKDRLFSSRSDSIGVFVVPNDTKVVIKQQSTTSRVGIPIELAVDVENKTSTNFEVSCGVEVRPVRADGTEGDVVKIEFVQLGRQAAIAGVAEGTYRLKAHCGKLDTVSVDYKVAP
jgi:hypothetical protein